MREFHVLNLGAGVQSTCLFLLAREPNATLRFDVAIFADTGEEPAAVYKHLDYLRSLGSPEIWIHSAGKLGDDLIHGVNSTGQRFASIPAFTAEDHMLRPGSCEHRLPPAPKYGMVRRQCTAEYKIRVIEKAIRREVVGLKPRQRMPRDVRVFQYFGITTDEKQRAERAKRRFEKTPWAVPVYPFLERGWCRQDCEAWLKDRLPHPVPRSACVFCPYRTNREWLHLKQTDPDGTLQNTVLLRFIKNKYEKVFITFDLDVESQVAKPLADLGFEKGKHYLPVGLNEDGKRDIEGLLPASVASAVFGANTDLVRQAIGTGKQKESARNQLKRLCLEEFKKVAVPGDEYYSHFYPLASAINKVLA